MNIVLSVLAPLILGGAALLAFLSPGLRPRFALISAQSASLLSFAASVATAALFVMQGPTTVDLAVISGYGLAFRLDAVSGSWRYWSRSSAGWSCATPSPTLMAKPAKARSLAGLCLTLAAVLVLVTSGNLIQLVGAWIATSLFLHRLLLFYPERPGAQRAARSKYVVARGGDIALVGSAALMAFAFSTGDIAAIADASRDGAGGGLAVGAAALMAFAAALKSAQFPTHGW